MSLLLHWHPAMFPAKTQVNPHLVLVSVIIQLLFPLFLEISNETLASLQNKTALNWRYSILSNRPRVSRQVIKLLYWSPMWRGKKAHSDVTEKETALIQRQPERSSVWLKWFQFKCHCVSLLRSFDCHTVYVFPLVAAKAWMAIWRIQFNQSETAAWYASCPKANAGITQGGDESNCQRKKAIQPLAFSPLTLCLSCFTHPQVHPVCR